MAKQRALKKTTVTIADVAREAGVSTQTVSRVINGKTDITETTRQHVQQVIDRLGYRPNRAARNLASNHNPLIGLVISDITNPFYPEIVRGVEDEVLQRNYNVLLFNTQGKPERERQVLDLLEEHRANGVIICAPRLPEAELNALLHNQRAAVVVNRTLPHYQNAGVVRVDDFYGATIATQHLLQTGHRHLAYINAARNSYSAPRRFAAFQQVLHEAGVPFAEADLREVTPSVANGLAAARELLSRQPAIDSLICFNDLLAVGALRACAELERVVPDQVAVIGFDDIMLAGLVTPALTTVHISKFDLGVQAARMLLRRIDGDLDNPEEIITPHLVYRQSTPYPETTHETP